MPKLEPQISAQIKAYFADRNTIKIRFHTKWKLAIGLEGDKGLCQLGVSLWREKILSLTGHKYYHVIIT